MGYYGWGHGYDCTQTHCIEVKIIGQFQQNLHTMLTKLSDQRWLVSQDTTNSKHKPWKKLVLDKTRSAYAELSSGLSSEQIGNVNQWMDKVTYRHSVARAWKQETVAKAINSQQGGTELGQAMIDRITTD